MALTTPLMDVRGHPIGRLSIFRSFETADQRLESLRWNILLTWMVAVLAGLALTYLSGAAHSGACKTPGPRRGSDRARRLRHPAAGGEPR